MGWNDRMNPSDLKRMFPDVYRDTYGDREPTECISLPELVARLRKIDKEQGTLPIEDLIRIEDIKLAGEKK